MSNYQSDNDTDTNYDTDTYNNDLLYNSEEKINPLWIELNDMRDKLRCYDIEIVKSYIKNVLSNDVIVIKKEFHKQFDDIVDNNDLKIEVMILLGELGIQINKKTKVLDETINKEYQALDLLE